MEKDFVFPGERIDDLQLNGIKIIQNPNWFCFGTDAVLLADFCLKSIKKTSKILDLCSGNGIIPLLLSQKCDFSHITGLEIQEGSASLASRSVEMNGLQDKIDIVNGDLKDSVKLFGKSSFDIITCNPPYKKSGGGIINSADEITLARHEILCSLEDIVRVSSNILAPYGKLIMIHRPERLCDIVFLMRKYKIEPKRLRFIHPTFEKTATMILVEGAYLEKPNLVLAPPLYMYKEKGVYSDEVNLIYNRRKADK